MNVNIDAKALVLDWMSSEAFIPVNKHVARQIGLNGAALLSETINQYKRWNKNNRLTDQGHFYWTEEDCEKETTLSRATQHRLFKKMEELNLLKRHKKRINTTDANTTRFIELSFEKVAELMIQDDSEARKKIADKYSNLKAHKKQYKNSSIPRFQNETSAKKAVISPRFQFEISRGFKLKSAEVSKWHTSKNLSFSKKVPSIKNENQSIKKVLMNLPLPDLVLNVLERNEDRLIDLNINLNNVQIKFEKYETQIPGAAFADILSRSLKYCKGNFDNYLESSLLKEIELKSSKDKNVSVTRIERAQEQSPPPELSGEEKERKQKELKKLLAKYKK